MYDIIGDIHGQYGKLTALFAKLGYSQVQGVFCHPEGRVAVFVGDLMDRGPDQQAVLQAVRSMIEAGSGRAVMGNHEWNAIGFATRHPDGVGHMRQHSPSKRKQHVEFLAQVGEDSATHLAWVAWFKTLPVFLDLGGIRVCHAWWDEARIAEIQVNSHADGRLKEDFLWSSFDATTRAHWAMEGVTKGLELTLPDGVSYLCHEGIERVEARIRWWDAEATTYRRAVLLPSKERAKMPDTPLPADVSLGFAGEVPVFVGHYWLSGTPRVQSPRVGVMDFGAAEAGPLVAYRWQGETALTDAHLVWA